tara:strand:+ start:1657 stop:2670 length:1014 start_codon:yes stop_codon:yes gene_type:complete
MNSQPATIDEHIINESRLISLNSKYATDFLNGSKKSNVVFDFNAIAKKDNSILYHTIAIQSAEITGAFYNLNDTNNQVNFTITGTSSATDGNYTMTIRPGNYNSITFKTEFEFQYRGRVGALDLVSFLFNEVTGRYQMTALTQNATITINLISTTCRLPLGIDENATGTLVFGFQGVPAAATFFPFPADFLGITKIKVCSNALAGDNYDSVSLNTSTLIDTISVSGGLFGLTIYNSLGRESFVKARRIDEIDIQLTDQDDNEIDFNNANWTFTIILNSHRRQMFSKDEGIINFAKMRRAEEATNKPEPLPQLLKELPLERVNIKEEEPDSDDDILLS